MKFFFSGGGDPSLALFFLIIERSTARMPIIPVSQRLHDHHHHSNNKNNNNILVDRLLQQDVANTACQDAKQDIETDSLGPNGDLLISCSCKDLVLTNTTTLNCINSCEYCDSNLEVCGIPAFGEVYDDTGNIISVSDSFAYTKSRADVVNIQQTNCTGDVFGDSFCDCNVLVSGSLCNSCMLSTCTSGINGAFALPSFDCSNIEPDAVYDLCDDSLLIPRTSVFAFLTREDGEFIDCIREDDTIVTPTVAPPAGDDTTNPTNAISVAPSAAITDAPATSAPIASDPPVFLGTFSPSSVPTETATDGPTSFPTGGPSETPSIVPTNAPSSAPSSVPSDVPSLMPSSLPSTSPSSIPSDIPSLMPSDAPSEIPSDIPSYQPTRVASESPSGAPSTVPTAKVIIFTMAPTAGEPAATTVPETDEPTVEEEEDDDSAATTTTRRLFSSSSLISSIFVGFVTIFLFLD